MIGIRREDKSEWERRTPLVPEHVRALGADHALRFQAQASSTRAFADEQYRQAGAEIVEDLAACRIVLGIKEIPPERFQPDTTYCFFSHTIKAQPANMPALRRIVELGCTLIDYERIVDETNRRLVFFGRYAGLAGMIDTIWALGQRLRHEGIDNPFEQIQPAWRYEDLDHFKREFAKVAEQIRAGGLPEAIRPFVCGFAGYGQVSGGAQEIWDLLPGVEVSPQETGSLEPAGDTCYKVVFREEHLVERVDASRPFKLQEYYDHPERYRTSFFPRVAPLTLLMNCIYWEPKYPRMITREQFGELYSGEQPRLRVIGDITCDIDGAIACTTRATGPEAPIYVYEPDSGETRDGVVGDGPVVLAVDFLPCELAVDASRHFSHSILPYVPGLAGADFSGKLEDSGLPPELQRATIVWKGVLTEPYQYLEPEIA